jgi:hypothetical protein
MPDSMSNLSLNCLQPIAQAVEIDPVIVDVARRFMSLSNPVGITAISHVGGRQIWQGAAGCSHSEHMLALQTCITPEFDRRRWLPGQT